MDEISPFFSIVTVVKDDVEGLRKTLASVCTQSVEKADLDCVVVDGGFLPEVRVCIQSVCKKKNTHALRHVCGSDNGIYDAMNKGITHACGDWVLFLNTGDVFCHEKVLAHVKNTILHSSDFAKNAQNYAYVAAAFYEKLRGYLVSKHVLSPQALPCAMPTSHQALFIRKAIAMQHLFDLRYKICADAHQIARVLKTGKDIFVYNEHIVTVLAHGYSTDNFALMMRERQRIQQELYPGTWHFLRVSIFVLWHYYKRYLRMIIPKKTETALRILKHKDKAATLQYTASNLDMKGTIRTMPAKTKQHILWVTTALDESAVSKVFFLLAPYLQKKYSITFVSIEPIKSTQARQTLSDMGLTLISLECEKLRMLEATRKLVRYIEKHIPDIIHAHLGRAYIVACAAYKRVKWPQNTPALLATFHNMFSYFSLPTRLALHNILPCFHGVSAVSQECLSSYSHLFQKSACKHINTTVIHNPVEYTQNSENPYDNTKNGSPILFCASRLFKGKGHDSMLHMMAKLSQHHPNACLYLAGEGPLRKHLEALTRRLGLGECVHFLGHIQRVYSYMKHADLVLFPSQGEGFGLVPCEAFLQETPVIMEDMPTARELFISDIWYTSCKDTAAFYTHVHDALQHKEQYHTHILNEKRAIMQQFHPQTIAQKYLMWFENILHKKHSQ